MSRVGPALGFVKGKKTPEDWYDKKKQTRLACEASGPFLESTERYLSRRAFSLVFIYCVYIQLSDCRETKLHKQRWTKQSGVDG